MAFNKPFHFKPAHPIWISISEAARLAGVQDKTIRRALKSGDNFDFKIVKNRYQIELGSLINYLQQSAKLKNKFFLKGLGQYVETWKTKNGKKASA